MCTKLYIVSYTPLHLVTDDIFKSSVLVLTHSVVLKIGTVKEPKKMVVIGFVVRLVVEPIRPQTLQISP